ncbi:disrupted in renal carcinoma protein 2 homolog [Acanthaster planci]|uniref:Disrupted in renal carcinoma protein 2 homolog n=1 Tax=Acanthaster planci TaxID=133434 RepID=A0A8B7XWQ3_ACAPL|nr:disrupted in renal carcinoma protein 2 homolog [Acanthaster planci]XP_022084687.1 disrupted in renal carcinoma protein 2 homolog [Acanthaster planci]
MMQDSGEQEISFKQDSDQDLLLGSTPLEDGINPGNGAYISLQSSGASKVDHKTYARRWYILAVFALLNLVQCVGWNTWGPIADTSKLVLNWTDGDIALLTNWGPITYVISGLFFSWILDTKGLRVSVVISSLLLFIGLGVRCFPVGITNTKWTVNVGQILIGFASPVLNGAPTILSAAWFPPHQRTTATAVPTAFIYLGFACSFLIGPQIVTDIVTANGTNVVPNNESDHWYDVEMSITPEVRKHHFNQIMLLMYIECGIGAILAFCTLVYYPARPPTPPSTSAATSRESFKRGALNLAKNPQFWLISLAYSISVGVYGSWSTQLDTLFQHTDSVDQDTVGWIGFYANIAGCLGGLFFARFVDRFSGFMKRVLLALAVLATGSSLWCLLLAMKFIPFHIEYLYISCISLGFFISATVPIYYEITVEGTYPIAEGITTMALTLMNNIVGLLFLLPPLIPGIGVDWMSWVVLVAAATPVFMLLLYRERYNRLKQDEEEECSVNADEQGT